jgi:hypothetical protein
MLPKAMFQCFGRSGRYREDDAVAVFGFDLYTPSGRRNRSNRISNPMVGKIRVKTDFTVIQRSA